MFDKIRYRVWIIPQISVEDLSIQIVRPEKTKTIPKIWSRWFRMRFTLLNWITSSIKNTFILLSSKQDGIRFF